jgi:HK97 family phage portal protein
VGLLERFLLGRDAYEEKQRVRAQADAFVKALEMTPDAVRTIQSGLWSGSYGAMYRRQPAVRAVVDFLARNIAQLNPKVYERVGDTDRLEVGDHALARLLRSPNPTTTRYRHIRDTVADLAVYDRAYWRKHRASGRLAAVERVPPQVLDLQSVDGRPTWVDTRTSARIPRGDLVIFHGYSPDGGDEGVSPLETLRTVLAEERAAQQHREHMWHNAARQSGWIERPLDAPDWSDDARRRFRADLEAVMTGGANAGRIGVLEEGMRWNGTSFSPKDTDYIAGRRLTYEEVCIAYGLQPSLLGMGGDTASSAEERHRQTYQDVLGPWLRMLQDEIELQVLPEFEVFNDRKTVYVEFNLAEKLKGSFEEQQKALTTAVGVPHMSVNEGRARLNLPRINEAWADQPVQPLNVMYGGQPATTVPVTETSTASAVPQAKALRIEADPKERDDAAKAHEDFLKGYFERQERAVTSAFKGKAAESRERWDRELQADLFILADDTVRRSGLTASAQMRGRYIHERTAGWLQNNSEIVAKSVNDHIFEAVDAASDLEEVRAAFEVARTSKAEALGLSLATGLVNFARTEAARHSREADGRERMKVWVVTSANSRHPHMNGEKAPVDGTFSNGARWPGDPVLGADEVAGCLCAVEFEIP